MKNKLSLTLVIDPNAVMTGFCYTYTKALLGKLRDLKAKKRVFEDTDKALSCQYKWDLNSTFCPVCTTAIAYAVLQAISNQIPWKQESWDSTLPGKVDKLIATAEEFLEIFEQS